jgi:CheY-like chemotaxis protein
MVEFADKAVLVVDDDPAILRTVQLILQTAGLNVVEARGGQECLEHLRAGFRGVILMDIMMPEMTGWETIQAIVDQGLAGPNPICVFTALGPDDPDAHAVRQHVADYIPKPFTYDELVGKVRHHLAAVA